MKTRIQFETLQQAIYHKKINGGRIVETVEYIGKNGIIFWYDHNYTQSEIFADLKGGLTII